MDEVKKTVSVIYEKSKHSNTVPITGAYGGIVPDRSGIMVHFFSEYNSIPNSTELEIGEGQKIDQTKAKNISRGDITREIHFSSFMTAQAAIALGEFLIKNGNRLINNNK